MIGNLAISVLALRPGVSVGEAIQQGARRFLPVLGAALLIGLASMLAMLPVVLLAAAGLAVALGIPALAAIPALLMIPLLVFLWTRLLLANPIGAVEPGGPVAILKRSWALTAGRFWQLLGFLILLADRRDGRLGRDRGGRRHVDRARPSARPGRTACPSIWC